MMTMICSRDQFALGGHKDRDGIEFRDYPGRPQTPQKPVDNCVHHVDGRVVRHEEKVKKAKQSQNACRASMD
eukprot:1154081-Pelagomonas_calceolata.AAC.2